MKIKLPEKLILNNLDDDQFMIIDEIELSDDTLSQAHQLEFHGVIFQIDRVNATVEKQSSSIVNATLEINGIYDLED